MSDFKVGDRVRVTQGGWGVGDLDVELFQNATVVHLITTEGHARRVILKGDRIATASVNIDAVQAVAIMVPTGLTPHKHRDTIIEWANGAAIQVSSQGVNWVPALKPAWHTESQYRVTPKIDTAAIKLCQEEIAALQEQITLLKENRV